SSLPCPLPFDDFTSRGVLPTPLRSSTLVVLLGAPPTPVTLSPPPPLALSPPRRFWPLPSSLPPPEAPVSFDPFSAPDAPSGFAPAFTVAPPDLPPSPCSQVGRSEEPTSELQSRQYLVC